MFLSLKFYTRKFFISFLATLFIIGCKKDTKETPEATYFKFELNGIPIDASNNAIANPPIPGGPSGPGALFISGRWSSRKIELRISSLQNPGIYNVSPDTRMVIYTPDGGIFYAGGDYVGGPIIGRGSITITEVSNDFARGKFEGQLVDNFWGTPEYMTVTNGEFYLKRKY